MRICIVGAGAVGGLFASWLSQGTAPVQAQVSVLARGATLHALQTQGLWLEAPESAPARVTLTAESDPARLGPQDLVIVAVKGPALAEAAPVVQALCHADTTVLVAMNGVPWWFFDALPGACAGLRMASVDPGDRIRACIPTQQVVGCVVHFSAATPAPGRVRQVQGRRLILGEAMPQTAHGNRLTRLAALLQHAGFEAETSACIQRDIWFKLWGNMTVNPVSALTGAASDAILDDPLVRAHLSAVMREAQEIGKGFGIPIDQAPEDRHAVTRKLGAFRTSMLQDVEAGRPLEIDALLGAVREVGQHLAVPTPHLDSLLGLTRLMARTRGLYPPA
jgi:2-dehydropantoate 2-reductase